jgi:hypothetical protein
LAAHKFLMRMANEQQSMSQDDVDRTFGIATDPITMFACVMSGLIHDTDHEGVPVSAFLIRAAQVCLCSVCPSRSTNSTLV